MFLCFGSHTLISSRPPLLSANFSHLASTAVTRTTNLCRAARRRSTATWKRVTTAWWTTVRAATASSTRMAHSLVSTRWRRTRMRQRAMRAPRPPHPSMPSTLWRSTTTAPRTEIPYTKTHSHGLSGDCRCSSSTGEGAQKSEQASSLYLNFPALTNWRLGGDTGTKWTVLVFPPFTAQTWSESSGQPSALRGIITVFFHFCSGTFSALTFPKLQCSIPNTHAALYHISLSPLISRSSSRSLSYWYVTVKG